MFETEELRGFLLVEDDPNDVLLMRRAFIKAKILNRLHVVTRGEEAIEYLSGTGRFANRDEFPLPAVVLLDLQMPGVDGYEVLRWIREQPGLRDLRVVVLTGLESARDIDLAYKCGANSYLIKPTDFERLVQITDAFDGCWCWMRDEPSAVHAGG